ncbi:Flagellin [Comamonas aquatilis]|uniref:flagellin n=1 Tax=Comamonas aquatilis TaxID=1778406 RepID=UPI0039F00106
MAMTINTNIQSLNAQRNLGTSQSSLSTSMQRLSSGMRINSAKDDAAGLAIAERMGAQVRGLNQAARNANDGVSLAQTAEGALSTIGGNLQRIRELAVQSRNATNSTDDRAALQKEVSQLTSEIDRVSKDTSFNGTNLLDGSFTAKAFQVGANQGQLINIDSIVDASTDKLGEWRSVDVPARTEGDTLKAGVALATSATMTAFTGGAANGAATLEIGGVNVFSKTVTAFATDAPTAADIDAALKDSKSDLAAKGISFTGTVAGGNLSVKKADGTDFTMNASAALGTLTGITNGTQTGGTMAFPATTAGQLTIKVGSSAAVSIPAIAGATTAKEFGENVTKAIETAFPDGSVKASFVGGKLMLSSDTDKLTIAGSKPDVFGLKAGSYEFVSGTDKEGFKDVDVSTVEGADNAILAMDAALKSVNSARADLGAMQNRFESVVSNLNVNSENLSASKSRITDADFAAETANLSRSQILQQAGTAMVAQANQLPQGVLSLLR